ncbi:uncharacterized protein LOC122510822 [Leptopilina heterotoma]|uniref:uncharacterized protein LOC122510822 n=1 Tax=Leptopilina heterotoma TaxID=63436 RepID=UPI001CA86543|nr:uncharacterized protein LOC122510822 [Leptopilina heterotoma]XP_043481668.1 uncharacterized protein LOC122510822 [Leptopilina heterotoma]
MESHCDEVTAVDSKNIKILNDYCLIHIFEYLTVDDKLNAEEVCKRWKELCEKAWCHYQFRKLSLNHKSWNLPCGLFRDYNTTRKILMRLSRYITSIDLSRQFPIGIQQEISVKFLCDVLESCNKIDTLFLTYPFNTDNDKMNELIKCIKYYAPQLMKFGYAHQSMILTDEMLFYLLSLMKNLKLFFIDSIIGDDFIEHLPLESLEEIIMENCGHIELNPLLDVLQKSTKLHTFCSSGLTAGDRLNFSADSPIKNLGITMSFSSNNLLWSLSVYQLKNIEKLNIELNDNVNDEFLYNLSAYCKKLTFLNFSGCQSVTDEGTRRLKTLPNLTYLALGGISNISGKYFGIISQLEVMDCRNCSNITDESLTGIIRNANNLKILTLSGCSLISNGLIQTAINATRRRENGIILYISIDRTSIKIKEINNESPMLILKQMIHYAVDCTSNYNGYFPTIYDFYHITMSKGKYESKRIRSYLKIN